MKLRLSSVIHALVALLICATLYSYAHTDIPEGCVLSSPTPNPIDGLSPPDDIQPKVYRCADGQVLTR